MVEVRNGGNAGTVLGEFPHSAFELIESRQTKQVHLMAGRFLERLQHVAQCETQGHITVELREGEGGEERDKKEGS